MQAEHQDQLNYLLGKYVALAVNNPKKYPKEPFLTKKQSTIFTSDEDRQQQARLKWLKKD